MMGLFDTHAHLDDEKFDSDREQIINSLKSNRVDYVVSCGDSVKSSYDNMKLADIHEQIYFSAGIHPHKAKEYKENSIEELKKLLLHKKAVAVGEIGLDYYYDFCPKETQIECFTKQIELAKELKLPTILHIREAFGDFMGMLRKGDIPNRSVMHCFSGSREIATECLNNDMMISFTGVITFNNSSKIRETVDFIPMDKIMIETDCPYLSPVPYRGKRNEPKYVIETAKAVAEIKKIPLNDVIDITTRNSLDFFGIRNEER